MSSSIRSILAAAQTAEVSGRRDEAVALLHEAAAF